MSLELLRRRIESTEGLHSVVGTMKALSLSRIRQCDRAAAAVAAYQSTIDDGLRIALRDRPRAVRDATRPAGGPVGTVVLGSAQGMCGRFDDRLAEFVAAGGSRPTRIAAAGARMAEALAARGLTPETVFDPPDSVEAIDDAVRNALAAIEGWRAADGVAICHHRRRSAAACDPVRVRLLPLDPDRVEALLAAPWPTRAIPARAGDPDRLFRATLRHALYAALFRAFADGLAAEHASRLVAMQRAEENVEERLGELLAEYHRRRQESITEEVLDVMGGFEVIAGSDP